MGVCSEFKYDAVLIVIHVGRVLQEPGLSVNGDGDRPVVLAGGMIQTSRVALVAVAELAPGVGGGGQVPGCRDGLGIFFRLGQIDGDVQFSVRGVRFQRISFTIRPRRI